jgi:hypothetical protein
MTRHLKLFVARVGRFLSLFGLALSMLPSAQAAIDGTVTNGTTGKPQANVRIMLVKPGQGGMQTLGTTKSDQQGHFQFTHDEPGGGPQLLQADFEGVNYNTLLTPNMPTSGVDVRVYKATKSPANARILQHMIVLEPSDAQTSVSETFILQNSSNETYANPGLGGVRFYVPRSADGQVRVSVQGPGGMPLPRTAEKTDETDVMKVDYPIKPGETQINLSYILHVGSPGTISGRVATIKGQPTGPVRFVVPPGVSLESSDINSLGQEPQTQAFIYDLLKPAYTLAVSGSGSLNQNSTSQSDSDAPQVEQKNPPVYQHLGWLVGLGLGILAFGLALLYRSSPVRAAGN